MMARFPSRFARGLMSALTWWSVACGVVRPSSAPPIASGPAPSAQIAQERGGDAPPEPTSTAGTDERAAPSTEQAEPTDDGNEDETSETPTDRQPPIQHPFDGLSDAELERRVTSDLASVGSLSIGRPSAGRLLNAVKLPPSPHFHLVDEPHAWGTKETVDAVALALTRVAETYPGTPSVAVGDFSAKSGGPLSPHVSHQSGRDVDVGLYYRDSAATWYRRATPATLDAARTWTLIRTLVIETDIELILLDRSLFDVVEQAAAAMGEPSDWVHSLFHPVDHARTIVRHASGHATHLHLRFYSPIAQESARRLMPILVKRALVAKVPAIKLHLAKPGDTLAKLATTYRTTMRAIRVENKMRGTTILAGRTYRIVLYNAPLPAAPPVRLPPRRLPPS